MSKSDLPCVAELPRGLSAVDVFQRLAHLPHVVFFDSVAEFGRLGRYSFVAADPFDWVEASASADDPLARISERCQEFSNTTIPNLPPFQGGVAGLLGYDLGRSLEIIPTARVTDFPISDMAVGFYDVVFAFDHHENRAWLISQGFPELEPTARRHRAEQRLTYFRGVLENPPRFLRASPTVNVPKSSLASQFEIGLADVTSNMSAAEYQTMVRRAVEYIHAGDVFQVNLAQRLLCPAKCDSVSLYLKLREKNPAPYAGFLNLGDWQICSSSPECFLQLRGRTAETRPIKGTRGRSASPEADLFTGDELQLSEKDRTENVMIVDLMRNDFSRVCTSNSVEVAELCGVETYAHVKHLVSAVRGTLRDDATPFDLLRACFPGGSITGAPKIRAMEIIAELEPTARGAYCGSLAYIGFDGQMDSSILIRTITAGGGWWQMPVGGGIVAQSDPLDEYRETWHKARGLLHALDLC
ncbi:MAG: aminodeoxychorismate synthase component I [Bythopirellula sp.]|nr:aminodeoxychorismate synthase component I [Bythopirellula sp.]